MTAVNARIDRLTHQRDYLGGTMATRAFCRCNGVSRRQAAMSLRRHMAIHLSWFMLAP